jgi:predicted pyridoxine 5'-phosphate oxidase superfamily flavin-nucleotide-binding protein
LTAGRTDSTVTAVKEQLRMAKNFFSTTFTPAVHEAQCRYYGAAQTRPGQGGPDRLSAEELEFIAQRDSFYLGTITQDGWPYIQHRGGPPGFLKATGENQVGFADLSGNRQLITTGNLAANDRVTLFLMDYPNRVRLKLLGHARVLDARENVELADKLSPAPQLRAKVERLFVVDVIAFDWNCPKYITPRFTRAEIDQFVGSLKQRIAELETQLKAAQR